MLNGRNVLIWPLIWLYAGNWNKSIPVRIQVFATDVKSSAHFETERKFLARCYHENIIKLYGVCSDHSPYYIITELAPLGTLNNYLVKSVRPFQELLKFAVQVWIKLLCKVFCMSFIKIWYCLYHLHDFNFMAVITDHILPHS